jgi:succinyl-diaminopimelate desuccinylase
MPPASSPVVDLTRELVAIDTCNPPGDERRAAGVVAARLEACGFVVDIAEFGPGRANVMARSPRLGDGRMRCWTGHLDTVPVGDTSWRRDPLGGEVADGRVHGRGTSDMKGGVAAMVVAIEQLCAAGGPPPNLHLILTGGEETGCEGAARLIADGTVPPADQLIVGEPTANRVVLAHKGVLWLELVTTGRAAHASRPDDGINAADALMDALVTLRTLQLPGHHPLLGEPTRSLGTIVAGTAINVVPDRATARVDLRLLPGTDPDQLTRDVRVLLGPQVELRTLTALPAVATEPDDPRITAAVEAVTAVVGSQPPAGVTYFTDASLLAPAMGAAVVVFGPGEPAQAHVTDEWCEVARLDAAVDAYAALAAMPLAP